MAVERNKNIGLAFFLLAFMSLSTGIGLKDLVQNILSISISISIIFLIIGIFIYRKKLS